MVYYQVHALAIVGPKLATDQRYQTGIGTYTKSNFVSPITTQISKTLDEMFAWNLASHVQGLPRFKNETAALTDAI